ncbi:MAG TPA: AAA family ATPase [Thermoanaerobaculia bacterium]
MTHPHTLAELRASGYRPRSVKDELRENLLAKLAKKEKTFPGIHGYERTVIPALHNAVLARHDIILLGLRGQAKTRILRALALLLDEAIPVIDGCEINDSPFDPTCKRCRRLALERGDELPVAWVHRNERYREKLATPDVTVADLVGDIDPIKAANQRLNYSDEEVIHYGIIPRTNRGIFAINELPDLAPRIQVALLNILEERDLQIRGFPIRIPLDILLVFSANPEDYTSRGNIITPLKDRIDSQILTHYPQDVKTAVAITGQEAWLDRSANGAQIEIPDYVRELIEHVAFVARESDLVDESSGVSARMPISAIEILHSNLERRAAITGDRIIFPRLADLAMILPAITGKVEMVYEGEQQGSEVVARKLIGTAVMKLYGEKFPPVERAGRAAERERRYGEVDEDALDSRVKPKKTPPKQPDTPPKVAGEVDYDAIVGWFMEGNKVTLSDEQPFAEYFRELTRVPKLAETAKRYFKPRHDAELGFGMELVLEALHQSLRLAREDLDSTITFSELVKFNVLRTVR